MMRTANELSGCGTAHSPAPTNEGLQVMMRRGDPLWSPVSFRILGYQSDSVDGRENRSRSGKINEVVYRGRHEAQMFVEGCRPCINSVDSHGSYSRDLGDLESPEKRIPYQCPGEPSSLMGSSHGQTGKNHDRDRIGHIPSNSTGGVHALHTPGRK